MIFRLLIILPGCYQIVFSIQTSSVTATTYRESNSIANVRIQSLPWYVGSPVLKWMERRPIHVASGSDEERRWIFIIDDGEMVGAN